MGWWSDPLSCGAGGSVRAGPGRSAIIADAISQLERREGMLPLSVEDRPRLSALIAAQPELLAAIREAHALASRHFPSGSELRLRVVRYTDTPEDGDQVVAEVWTPSGAVADTLAFVGLLDAWIRLRPGAGTLPLVLVERSR